MIPLMSSHANIVYLTKEWQTAEVRERVLALTIGQVHALNRLGLNGWTVDLNDFLMARDGMLEGTMTNKGGTKMFVGIHPSGSTHT